MCKRLTAGMAIVAALALAPNSGLAAEKLRVAAAEPADKTAAPTAMETTPRISTALEVAADLGVLNAQLKLARTYALGDGVQLNQGRAFEVYERIIKDHSDVRPGYYRANGVARAYVALGNYFRSGIPGVVKSDKAHAATLLRYAATYLGDPEAQSDLAQMYLDGEGVTRSPRLAVSWLANAAKKGHAKSQALLGDLLWRGTEGLPRQTSTGLALLSLARQNATDKTEARWINALYQGAYSGSPASVRERAAEFAELWRDRLGRPSISKLGAVVGSQPRQEVDTPASSGFRQVGMDVPEKQR